MDEKKDCLDREENKTVDLSKKNYSFYTHRECEFFPCHKTNDPDNFNCLFCYCPLYALGPNCGGNYKYNESGCKDCVRSNYDKILERYSDIIKIASDKKY